MYRLRRWKECVKLFSLKEPVVQCSAFLINAQWPGVLELHVAGGIHERAVDRRGDRATCAVRTL